MSKNTLKKTITKTPRLYFISNEPDEDLKKIKDYFENKNNETAFYNKVYKTTTTNKDTFINIKLNIDLQPEERFKKVAKKFNEILNKSYKIFYNDANDKYSYIPDNIINDMNKSIHLFINDD